MTFSQLFLIKRPSIRSRVSSLLWPPEFSLRLEEIPALLPDHLHTAADKLPDALKPFQMSQKEVTMYYPGCGQDMIWPIIAMQGVAPDALKWTIIGQDITDTIGALISTTQAITGQTAFSMIKKGGTGDIVGARFRFKGKTIDIFSSNSDALSCLPGIVANGYDIYFERGFELMRSQRPGFLDEALGHLRSGGLAITDAGFPETTRHVSKSKTEMQGWGFYKNPAVYVKTPNQIKRQKKRKKTQ